MTLLNESLTPRLPDQAPSVAAMPGSGPRSHLPKSSYSESRRLRRARPEFAIQSCARLSKVRVAPGSPGEYDRVRAAILFWPRQTIRAESDRSRASAPMVIQYRLQSTRPSRLAQNARPNNLVDIGALCRQVVTMPLWHSFLGVASVSWMSSGQRRLSLSCM